MKISAKPKKKINYKYVFLVLGCLIIFVPTSIIIWTNTEYSQIVNARKIFKTEKDSLAGYNLYLSLYPKGKYNQEAKEKIENNKTNNSNVRYVNTRYWRERDIVDIFGDTTGEKLTYNEFIYIIDPHSKSFKRNGEIVITDSNIYFDFHPDSDSRESRYDPKFDGKYFKFRYKVEGEKINNDIITSEYIFNKGYKLPIKFMNIVKQWRSEKSSVKFLGVRTSGSGGHKEIQFTIQF